MRHVNHQISADRIGDFAEFAPVHHSRIGGEAANNHFRFVLVGQLLNLIIIDLAGGFVQAVLHRVVELAGKADFGAVGQMPAVRQRHTKHGIAGLTQTHINRGIGLRPGMRLHIGVTRAKQLFCAVDGQLLGDIDIFTTAVITPRRIAFGILVGEHRALRLHHPRAGVVFGGYQFDMLLLTAFFVLDGRPQGFIVVGDIHFFGKHNHSRRRSRLTASCDAGENLG